MWTFKNPSTVLARFAHDLCFEVRRFSLQVREAEGGEFEVTLRADPLELQLLGSVATDGQLSPIKPRDQLEIERTARDTVLEARRYPEVVFRGEGSWEVLTGTLELHGAKQALTLRSERDGERCAGQVEFAPSRFGIQPYRAFLGALKLDDRVRVSWDLRVISA
ncbi:MAG: YceI family protein [Planctomycetes bacterium]|nr:YceI family protein [Planctomycetota bacterium]